MRISFLPLAAHAIAAGGVGFIIGLAGGAIKSASALILVPIIVLIVVDKNRDKVSAAEEIE